MGRAQEAKAEQAMRVINRNLECRIIDLFQFRSMKQGLSNGKSIDLTFHCLCHPFSTFGTVGAGLSIRFRTHVKLARRPSRRGSSRTWRRLAPAPHATTRSASRLLRRAGVTSVLSQGIESAAFLTIADGPEPFCCTWAAHGHCDRCTWNARAHRARSLVGRTTYVERRALDATGV
jgi:hypothetical protein